MRTVTRATKIYWFTGLVIMTFPSGHNACGKAFEHKVLSKLLTIFCSIFLDWMNQGLNPFNHTSKHYKNRKLDIENRMSKRTMFYQLSEALRGGEDIHSSGKERNDIILTFSFIKISANK